MTEEEAFEYAMAGKLQIWDRINAMSEKMSKNILLYVVARYAEGDAIEYACPKKSIDAEMESANVLLDEALDVMEHNEMMEIS